MSAKELKKRGLKFCKLLVNNDTDNYTDYDNDNDNDNDSGS